MATTFFTSDPHFGHQRIVDLAYRPFASLDEMHHGLISNWNATVTQDDDITWVLGDLSIDSQFKVGLEAMRQCRGRKRFITGNHDRAWVGKKDFDPRIVAEYLTAFEVVSPWARAKLGQVPVLLSHFPYDGDHTETARYADYRMVDSGRVLVHGHTHDHGHPLSRSAKGTLQVHVGVDAWGYAPVPSHALATMVVDALSEEELRLTTARRVTFG